MKSIWSGTRVGEKEGDKSGEREREREKERERMKVIKRNLICAALIQ